MKGGAPHAPFPESRGKCQKIDMVPGMGAKPVGESLVRSSVKGFQKQKTFRF